MRNVRLNLSFSHYFTSLINQNNTWEGIISNIGIIIVNFTLFISHAKNNFDHY